MWMRTGMRLGPGVPRLKMGLTVSNPLTVGLRVRDVDCAGDAVDVTAHDLSAAHQLDLSRISHPDRSKVRLLEISVDPE